MAFCGNCGKELTMGDKFCPNCGAPHTQQNVPVTEESGPVGFTPPVSHLGYDTYPTSGRFESDMSQVRGALLFLIILEGLTLGLGALAVSLFDTFPEIQEQTGVTLELIYIDIAYSAILVIGFLYLRSKFSRRDPSAFGQLKGLAGVHLAISVISFFAPLPGGGIIAVGLTGLIVYKLSNKEFQMVYLQSSNF